MFTGWRVSRKKRNNLVILLLRTKIVTALDIRVLEFLVKLPPDPSPSSGQNLWTRRSAIFIQYCAGVWRSHRESASLPVTSLDRIWSPKSDTKFCKQEPTDLVEHGFWASDPNYKNRHQDWS